MNASVGNELMVALSELRSLFPDWRFGQLVANLALATGREGEGVLWEVEDAQLLSAALRLIERNRHREEVRA